MVLWDIGGVYPHNKLALVAPLKALIDRSKDVIYTIVDSEASETSEEGLIYWNAVIGAQPRDRGLLQAIKDVIKNVETKKYAFGVEHFKGLYITGPGRLSRSLRRADSSIVSFGNFTKDVVQ